ncbi:membrane metalloprotease [Flavobacterium sp. 3HN19-14]|uniref:membrane metalloprotease n=1 Tax=Flavobacterium sp. 3HN19-14 TaxID=3448133 RepID=UPI003EE3010E
MKLQRFLLLFLVVFALGCSSDDNSSDVENGVNKAPNLKATGSSAHDFLSADDYDALHIEILYVAGFQPDAAVLTNLQNFMAARLNKPGGITITQRQIASPGTSPYTIAEISDLESDTRTLYNDVNVLTLCVLFVDGNFNTDTATTFTLGTAYRNTSCVIYENSVRHLSSGVNLPTRVNLETTVLLHELCHLLGLVDLGSTMQTEHRDEAHGKHCDNENCLMYWQTENNMMNNTTNHIAPLDANCLADLQANGGK